MDRDLENKALSLLDATLRPLPHERNELDWKLDLSENGNRLAQHLSAFANQAGGGFLVFGVNQRGIPDGVPNHTEITQRLGNIARDGVVPSIILDHAVLAHSEKNLLFVYVPESIDKPVHLRSGTIDESYIRSAGQTRKMTRREVADSIALSRGVTFEEGFATPPIVAEDVINLLDIQSFFELLGRSLPEGRAAILSSLHEELLVSSASERFMITNLGAVLFGKDLSRFDRLHRKAVRVVVYEGADRLNAIKEQVFQGGYASSFKSLLGYISDQLPRNEVIESALRREVKMYPELAIRELVANALIHQDFSESGTGPMVEIFAERLEITNPGRPLISTDRFIDYPPRARNEKLASFMRRINICEERGSGIDKVIFQVELFQLPAPTFETPGDNTRVTLFSQRPLNKMERADKIRACYQHCCLKFVSGARMSNQTLRDRFKIEEKNYATASRIIADTIDHGSIKPADPQSKSKKYATYVPFWA